MARPVKPRRICELPQAGEFVPVSAPDAEIVDLTLDEYETIRLIDYLGFAQEDCALQMNVARTTVQAIYDTARRKLADVLVHGKRLRIRGGCYALCPKAGTCCGKNCRRRVCEGMRCKAGNLQCEYCRQGSDQ